MRGVGLMKLSTAFGVPRKLPRPGANAHMRERRICHRLSLPFTGVRTGHIAISDRHGDHMAILWAAKVKCHGEPRRRGEWIFWLGRTSTNALAEAHAVGRRARKQHRIG